VIPNYGPSRGSLGEQRRRNRHLILATLVVLVVLIYGLLIRQRLEERRAENEVFPPESWTIVEPGVEGPGRADPGELDSGGEGR